MRYNVIIITISTYFNYIVFFIMILHSLWLERLKMNLKHIWIIYIMYQLVNLIMHQLVNRIIDITSIACYYNANYLH